MQLTQDVWMTFGTFNVYISISFPLREKTLSLWCVFENLYFSKDVHPHKETALMKLERDIIWYHILINVNYFGIRNATLNAAQRVSLSQFCEALFSFFSSSVFCFGSPSSFWRAPFRFPNSAILVGNLGERKSLRPWWKLFGSRLVRLWTQHVTEGPSELRTLVSLVSMANQAPSFFFWARF